MEPKEPCSQRVLVLVRNYEMRGRFTTCISSPHRTREERREESANKNRVDGSAEPYPLLWGTTAGVPPEP